MRAAIYTRKSSDEQSGVRGDAKSVARQGAGARGYITSKGWEHTGTYTDDGIESAATCSPADPSSSGCCV